MCPCNYNRFSDRARYWSKIVIFSYPLAAVDGVPVGTSPPRPFGMEKLEWLGYQIMKNLRNSRTCMTDRQTDSLDRHRVTAYTALMHSIAR